MRAQRRSRAHVWISGRVQGVFFRSSTEQVARRHGLAGWVRNLPDGRVEAVFEGVPAAVQTLVDWCREGPPTARVERVDVHWEPLEDEPPGFRVR